MTYLASLWIIFETVNVAWPRNPAGQPWYINWASVLTQWCWPSSAVVIYLSVRRGIKAPIGERLSATPPPQ